MPAKGKNNAAGIAAAVAAGRTVRILITDDRTGRHASPAVLAGDVTPARWYVSQVKTKVVTATVTGSDAEMVGGRSRSRRVYTLHTDRGDVAGLAPIETLWLAPEPKPAAPAVPVAQVDADAPACLTCGGKLTRDFAGWMHARKPERRHVTKPNAAAQLADAARAASAEPAAQVDADAPADPANPAVAQADADAEPADPVRMILARMGPADPADPSAVWVRLWVESMAEDAPAGAHGRAIAAVRAVLGLDADADARTVQDAPQRDGRDGATLARAYLAAFHAADVAQAPAPRVVSLAALVAEHGTA